MLRSRNCCPIDQSTRTELLPFQRTRLDPDVPTGRRWYSQDMDGGIKYLFDDETNMIIDQHFENIRNAGSTNDEDRTVTNIVTRYPDQDNACAN
jgi:hypothetical protein